MASSIIDRFFSDINEISAYARTHAAARFMFSKFMGVLNAHHAAANALESGYRPSAGVVNWQRGAEAWASYAVALVAQYSDNEESTTIIADSIQGALDLFGREQAPDTDAIGALPDELREHAQNTAEAANESRRGFSRTGRDVLDSLRGGDAPDMTPSEEVKFLEWAYNYAYGQAERSAARVGRMRGRMALDAATDARLWLALSEQVYKDLQQRERQGGY